MVLNLARFLLRVARTYPWSTAQVVGLTVAGALFEGLGIGMLVPLIEAVGIGSGSKTSQLMADVLGVVGIPFELGPVLVVFLGIQVARVGFTFLQTSAILRQQFDISADMMTKVFNALSRAGWTHTATHRAGHVINVIVNETRQVGAAFAAVAELMSKVLVTVVYLAIAARVSLSMVLLVLALGLVSALVLRPLFRRALARGDEAVNFRSQLQSIATDHMHNAKLIRAMNLGAWSREAFRRKAQDITDSMFRLQRGTATVQLLFEPAAIGLLCLVIYLGRGVLQVPLPSLVLLIFVFARLVPQLTIIQQRLHLLVSLLPSDDLVMRTMIEAKEAHLPAGRCADASFEDCIRFEGVRFGYPEHTVLDGIDLDIRKGGITALIGPSGSGKTTVVDLLVGLHRPQEGRILVDGHPLADIDHEAWCRGIGYVGQETQLFHASLRENLSLGLDKVDDEFLWECLDMANAADFVRASAHQLDTVVGDQGLRLSGGQRQRISLARALARRPRLLVLDEGTSALDYKSEERIQDAVANLRGRVTVVLVAHRLSTLRGADLIYRLDKGRIVASGTFDQLGLASQIH